MKCIVLPALLALAAATPALAQSKGDWTIGLGLGYVQPKDDNGLLAGAATTIAGPGTGRCAGAADSAGRDGCSCVASAADSSTAAARASAP